jgi:single-strand DNA-binding protein
VNKVILVGNLGRDAELKFTPGGFPISNFSLATTDRRKDKDGQYQEKTEWHRVKVLGKQAESLQDYLTKGKQVYVEGRLETRSWDQDGEKKYMTEIIADRIQLLGGRGDGGSNIGARAERAARGRKRDDATDPFDDSQGGGGEVADDDIPF